MFASLIPSLFQPFSKRENESAPEENIEETFSTPHNQKIPLWISQIGQTYNNDSENPTSEFVADAESDFFSNRIFVFYADR